MSEIGTVKYSPGSSWRLQELLSGQPVADVLEGHCWVCAVALHVEGWTGPAEDRTAITFCPCCRFRFQVLNTPNGPIVMSDCPPFESRRGLCQHRIDRGDI